MRHDYDCSRQHGEPEQCELEEVAVTVASYRLGPACITEIERLSGAVIARGVGRTPEESRQNARELAAERLLRQRGLHLTVGG
jgi:hypothetical protein